MNKIEILGTVLKEEQMEVMQDLALPRTLVLHIVNPFPGLHGEIVPESATRPDNIFFVTKKPYSWEKIIRTTNKIKQNTAFKELDASFATVMFGKTKYYSIRVHNIPSFKDIAEVQAAYKAFGGFEFHKRDRKNTETASIKLAKFFELEPAADACYHDLKRKHMYYAVLPKHLVWDDFKRITFAIKDDLDIRNFDVALATFFMDENVFDVLRIYKPGITAEQLKLIREKYSARIKDLHL